MRQPIPWDLFGDRGVEFNDTLPLVGADLTGGSFSAPVRLYPDAPGSALFSLTATLTYGGTDTIANHIAANRVTVAIKGYRNPATGLPFADADSVALSLIKLHAASALMVAPGVPAASEVGDPVKLAWNLMITPLSGVTDKWVAGYLNVRGTVAV